jgi:hypothetical protein
MKCIAGPLLFLSERVAFAVLAIAVLACVKLVIDHTSPGPHRPMVIVALR